MLKCARPSTRTAIRYFESDCRSPKFPNPRARECVQVSKTGAEQEPIAIPRVVFANEEYEEAIMGRGILLWLLGVPIPVIILLWLFFGR